MMFFALLMLWGNPTKVAVSSTVSVEVVIPQLDARPYHRPYVAVWLETEEREGVQTLAVWHEQNEWLKDMRQWWRKLGRSTKPPIDGISGATRKPGSYTIRWDGTDPQGKPIPPGTYILNIEAAREEGGRDFLRQKIELNSGKTQQYSLSGNLELGDIVININ